MPNISLKQSQEKPGAETLPDVGLTSQTDGVDEGDEELMCILQQDSMLDSIGSHEDKQERNEMPFDNEDESNNSEQNNGSIGKNRMDARNC
jgi:hypothetical protein